MHVEYGNKALLF